MKRLVFWIAGLPCAAVIIALSVANRASVRFSLDPISTTEPAVAFELPLFILLFGAGFAGLVIGWSVAFTKQVHWRREARRRQRDAENWRQKAAAKETAQAESRGLVKAA